MFVILFLSIVLFSQVAFADVDLSNMSFDELVDLKGQINLALWNSEKWQEVAVPAGVYEIGKDIPVGRWTIHPADGQTAEVYYGVGLEHGGTSIKDTYDAEQITSPSDSYSEYNDIESVTWTLEEGAYIKIESSSVVFTPFSGFDFSFK